ncbi:DUF924 family protein [Pelagovum sp. HNIBRBA483]|uniref:DUF924 family protein n=1 Tax=Pelagovum sp. HNIBRBA483 TaxID=3233341 RepID=UPI0034A2E554
MVQPDDILSFWLDEVDPSEWYNSNEELDAKIREKFGGAWQDAMEGSFGLWLTYPTGTLAYIILLDQFSRNIFRGDSRSFASDAAARAAAKVAIHRDWDLKIDEPARQFFYLPLMHSENLSDQDRAVRLFCSRMPKSGAGNLLHAKVHREIIRKFGRFPYRNDVLSRQTTTLEQQFLEAGGYGEIMRALQEKSAAVA